MLSSKLVESMSQKQATARGGGACLTTPGVGVSNDGYDNELNDLILSVDDVLVSSTSSNRRQATELTHYVVLKWAPCMLQLQGLSGRVRVRLLMHCYPAMCRYHVQDMLGQGTFGQVVRCVREDTREEVAVKVIKNQTAFYHQVQGWSLWHGHLPSRAVLPECAALRGPPSWAPCMNGWRPQ